MNLLYKKVEDQTTSCDIDALPDGRLRIDFYSDCGKFGMEEMIDGYVLTPVRLLEILQERDDYKEEEL